MISVSEIRFRRPLAADRRTGVLAFASCVVRGEFRFDDLAVRKVAVAGQLYVQYPARRTRGGRRRYAVAPVSDAVRRAVEEQILAALPRWARDGEAGP